MLKLIKKPLKISLSILIFTIFCGLWTIDYGLCTDNASKEEEALFVAEKAFGDGFYEVSLQLLERFLKNYPDSLQRPQAELLIGECYFYQNRFLDALNKFEELLNQPAARKIKDASLYWIAEVHFKGNSFNRAAMYYKEIIDNFADSSYLSAAYYSLGWCMFEEKEFAAALKYFRAVENKFPQEARKTDAAFKAIECLYNLKDYAGLKQEIKPYLKLYSREPSRLAYLYFYLAEADYYLNNFDQAIQEYSRVLSERPVRPGGGQDDNLEALCRLGIGWSYLKLKQYVKTEESFLRIGPEKLEKTSRDVLLLGRAILMTETGRINQAEQIYSELILSASQPLVLAQGYLGKADLLYNQGLYIEAVNLYKEALDEFDSADIPAQLSDKLHYNLAWAYLKEGEFKQAIKAFQNVARESDDKIIKVSALCQVGDAYQDAGDYRKAQESYDSLLKEYPDSFYGDYVQYQLGLTMLKSSNYDGAAMSFLALKRNYPQSKILDDATYALGLAYFQKQDYNLSREVFEKFEDEFKESNLKPQALYLLGTSLYNLAEFEGAIETFKKIARLYSRDDKELVQKAEYEIADCFYRMGEEFEAMKRFKLLRAKYPDSSLTCETVWWLGEYYYRHNDLPQARRYFSTLIRDFPQSNLRMDAYYALGSIYAQESRNDQAIENFRKATELGKSDLAAQASIAMADIYLKEGKSDLALGVYKEIVTEYPNLCGLIYPKMAELFAKEADYNQALEYYRRSLDIVPARTVPAIQLKIAEVMQAQGKTEEAIEVYLKTAYLYSSSQDSVFAVKSLLRIAEIYEGKENFKEALNVYKRVISMNTEEAKYAEERVDWINKHVK
ncbi:MAG: tetratricopeptide repeat protein [Candidatus Omnitrophota bacterium]|nr:tetratricopeptide repeat protein [Candidatus Omnitrophota bacterium]